MAQPSRERIRYVVVGAGNLAQVAVLPSFVHAGENSELAAIVSGDPEKRMALGALYRVPTCEYDELETLIARERVDALYLSVPNTVHRVFVERGARAGVHILCEKPLAMTTDDCRAMLEACDDAGVRLTVAYRLHFEEANLRAVEVVRSGFIGNARYFSAALSQQVRPGNIRTRSSSGGGALFDLGVYCVNAARSIFRAEPAEVTGYQLQGADPRFRETDEMTAAVLRFPGGRLAQFTVSQGASAVDTLRVVGTEGDLRMEPAFTYDSDLKQFLTRGGDTEEMTFARRDQFAPELIRFSAAILDGTAPRASGREGLADVRVMEAIEESNRTGRSVLLGPFDPGARPEPRDELQKPPVDPPSPIRAPSPSL